MGAAVGYLQGVKVLLSESANRSAVYLLPRMAWSSRINSGLVT